MAGHGALLEILCRCWFRLDSRGEGRTRVQSSTAVVGRTKSGTEVSPRAGVGQNSSMGLPLVETGGHS
jgi:hypothetical protein